MINIRNNDNQFHDLELALLEIIYQLLHTHDDVVISVNNEGPDLTKLGLYSLLSSICTNFKVPTSRIKVRTRNLLETSDSFSVNINPPFTFVEYCRKYASVNSIPSKNFISTFGIFIGRSSWERLWLASHLYSKHNKITELTYHYDHSSDYYRANLGLDMLISEVGPAVLLQVNALLQDTPILHDIVGDYPIDGLKQTVPSINLAPRYCDFFVEIVCETYTAGKSFFPTEKTWRAIMCKTPFIVHGPQYFIENLHKLGIKTFNKWWDESYDYKPGKTKVEEIILIIDMLAKKSITELESMYNEMLPDLENNYNVLMNLTDTQMLAANYVK